MRSGRIVRHSQATPRSSTSSSRVRVSHVRSAHPAREVRTRRRARLAGCSDLSPGERTRVHLAELQARGVNLLVLDEPTNHLDLEAVEQLESALHGFDGTLVVVSHDRRFLEHVAPTREVAMPPR